MTQAATPALHTGFHPAHSAPFPTWARGDGERSRSLGTASLPSSPGLGGTHPSSGHLTPLAAPASTFPGSWRSRCSVSLPTWSSRRTSHCDSRSFRRPYSHPSCPKQPSKPPAARRGVSRDRNPSDFARGLPTVVHFMSIYNGLCNMFPSFNLTCYKLKPFCVGGGRSSSFSANKSTVKT